ncbi:MAG: hypothetical protein KGI65_03945 [Acidobacteriota bacterium]|nr:hypothetical protein [Acidobacteriota bacterium]MDE3082613.1 hypothetical protein [Acidobacteriota bacterium]
MSPHPAPVLSPAFIYVGVALSMIGYLVYVRDVRRGLADPDLVTWGLWTAIPLLAFATQMVDGVGLIALTTFAAGVGPGLVLVAALRAPRPPHRLHPIDYLCAGTAVVGVIIWSTTGSPTLGLWAFLAGQLAAGTPTLFKVWFEPDSESKTTYVMDIVTSALALLCVTKLTIATAGFAVVETSVAVTALTFSLTKVGYRVHGIVDAHVRAGGGDALAHLPHAHQHLTHYHPTLRPHLPEHRPRYFEHLSRLRAELARLEAPDAQG